VKDHAVFILARLGAVLLRFGPIPSQGKGPPASLSLPIVCLFGIESSRIKATIETRAEDDLASNDLKQRLQQDAESCITWKKNRRFEFISYTPGLAASFDDALAFAAPIFQDVSGILDRVENIYLEPLVRFYESLIQAAEIAQSVPSSFPQKLARARGELEKKASFIMYGVFRCIGLMNVTPESIATLRDDVIQSLDEKISRAETVAQGGINQIRQAVEEKSAELKEITDGIITSAENRSVKAAKEQFGLATTSMKFKAKCWLAGATACLLCLVGFLFDMYRCPPPIILHINEALAARFTNSASQNPSTEFPLPMLLVGSAYYTSIRLAVLAVLGIVLTFCIRMGRAYLHLIELNEHRLRIAISIRDFVDAVRRPEQKDMVIQKLVESVMDLGDSGILSKQQDGSVGQVLSIDSLMKNFPSRE
jgi:hypothetical protein